MRRAKIGAWLAALAALALPASAGATTAYTLYRNSLMDSSMRIHIATFDAADGEQYNRENCSLAADLFQRQPGTRTRFWCEPGAFRK